MAYDSVIRVYENMLSNLKSIALLTLKFGLLGSLIAFTIRPFLRQKQDGIGNYTFKL